MNTCYVIHHSESKDAQYIPAHMNAFVGPIDFRVLVDTGASISLIQGEMYDEMIKKKLISNNFKRWTGGTVRTAAENGMAVRGTTQIEIVLKGDNIRLTLEVAIINGLTKELIMGIDVLNKLSACIDLKRRCITLDWRFTFPLDIGNE